MSSVIKRHERGSKMLLCTACPNKSDAEVIHPHLQVPICGACSAALKDADVALVDDQINSCCWCGNADDIHLFMCDTCPRSFCEECVARNFGTAESNFVKDLEVWACYVCIPTPKLKSLQVHGDIKYFNIDRAYNSIRPPNVQEVSAQSTSVLNKLTPEERNFAAIFSGSVGNVSIQDSELIGQYLTAIDFAVVLRVSSGLRKYFHSEVNIIPGLFKTEYGAENNCRLYNHQIVSLNRMTQIENASKDFGALRGGIFGDEPGLGKTVTTLALVASTAGLMPQQPSTFWDKSTIDEHWLLQKGQFGKLLGPVLNALQKSPAMGAFQLDRLHTLRINVEKHCSSVETFEAAVRTCIREEIPRLEDRSRLLDLFRQEMTKVKEGLDRSQRKNRTATANTPLLKRVRFERSLCPSSATLIVVPLALLEHWYEQIKRHLNLQYFTNDSQQRGVVYLDGLGDIVDVEAPLSKLKVEANSSMASVQFLSHYMVVVTTFERCAAEYRMRQERGNDVSAASELSLLQMRWLRLVVDEGHEIGKSSSDLTAARVTRFISQIAAERRWVMSGTPTTGAKSDVALEQLYRLLQFLRHPRIVSGTGMGGVGGSSSVVKCESSNSIASNTSSKTKGVKRKASSTDLRGDSTEHADSENTTSASEEVLTLEMWRREVVVPCLAQKEVAWQYVIQLLKTVLLRHTKGDIHLFEPVRSGVNLELNFPREQLAQMTDEERTVAIDQCKATYIAETMQQARREYKQFVRSGGVRNSEALRRNILSRMNHNRLSSGTTRTNTASTTSGSAVSITANTTCTSNSSSAGNNVKVFSLAQLKAQLKAVKAAKQAASTTNVDTSTTDNTTITTTNTTTTVLTSPVKHERALTGTQSTIGSTLSSNASTNAAPVDSIPSRLHTMLEVTEAEKELCSRVRVPKAIVFSLNHWDLQGVGHQLILQLGESSICEHFGTYRSSELSRFRHSKKKFRECPMCGHCNQITTGNSCANTLLLVEYVNMHWMNQDADAAQNQFPAEPAGHGRLGPGGHYTGKCLCSPQGCVPPPELPPAAHATWFCGQLPNPFYKAELVGPEHFHHTIVSYEHIEGYVPGMTFNVGDHVHVRRQNACPHGGVPVQNVDDASLANGSFIGIPATNAQLWSGGILGGHGIVRGWRHCGGKSNVSNWHGDKILQHVPWRVEAEDATILLLKEDGSTGLDLSFATHIFLLGRIKDPALRNQIVSRAHRMGAQGPVQVVLVQVSTENEDGVE